MTRTVKDMSDTNDEEIEVVGERPAAHHRQHERLHQVVTARSDET